MTQILQQPPTVKQLFCWTMCWYLQTSQLTLPHPTPGLPRNRFLYMDPSWNRFCYLWPSRDMVSRNCSTSLICGVGWKRVRVAPLRTPSLGLRTLSSGLRTPYHGPLGPRHLSGPALNQTVFIPASTPRNFEKIGYIQSKSVQNHKFEICWFCSCRKRLHHNLKSTLKSQIVDLLRQRPDATKGNFTSVILSVLRAAGWIITPLMTKYNQLPLNTACFIPPRCTDVVILLLFYFN